MTINSTWLSRRDMLATGLGGVFGGVLGGVFALVPKPLLALPEDVQAVQRKLYGGRPIIDGRVSLKLPPLAENGNSVALSVDVASPMTKDDYVKQVIIFAPRNPLPVVAKYTFSPLSGRARVATRIRLGNSQTVQAVAEMNNGKLYSGSAETVVTLAACVVI